MDHTKDKRSKWKALHIYEGVRCARIWMKGPGGALVTGCNADGIALQFHSNRETGKVIVKELKETNFYPLGDGDELTEQILSQLGGEEGLERVRMDRLYELWGGRDNYERLFGMVRYDDAVDDDGALCAECGAKLVQKKLRCSNCTHDRPQWGK